MLDIYHIVQVGIPQENNECDLEFHLEGMFLSAIGSCVHSTQHL